MATVASCYYFSLKRGVLLAIFGVDQPRHMIVPAISGGATVMDAVFDEANDAGNGYEQ